jgi:beta-galactosidase
VAVPVEEIHLRPNQTSVRVPIQNDFDFTELSTVALHWNIMAGDRELAQGDAHVNAAPHTAGYLTLPVNSIKTIEPGTAYYSHLAFLRADGSEITRRSVELLFDGPAPEPVRTTPAPVRMRPGKTLTVTAGPATYEFDPASARLVSASAGGAALVTGSRFTLWRPLNTNDLILVRTRPADIADLNQYTTAVKSWKVAEDAAGVRIEAETDQKVNERNSFAVSYVYQVGHDGVLRVHYTVRPHVEFAWLPEIGMEFETAGLDHLRWLGLGPLDAYPNEKTAPILGVYSGLAGSETAKGDKAIRWAELTSGQGAGLRVEGVPYIRVEGKNLRVLPSVAGRNEKNRRPESPEYRLDTANSAVFEGAFSLAAIAPEKK